MPFRGFYVVVPPEYRRLGCLPPEQFVPQYLESRGEPHYVGLLSAARYHGAGHQAAQVFQVVVGRPRRSVRCGRVRATFLVRKKVRDVPTVDRKTPRGSIRVSTPEATVVDLVGFPHQAGGLDNVATIIGELDGTLRSGRLVRAAALAPVTWAQRLGFLLERSAVTRAAGSLHRHVHRNAREYVPLSPRAPIPADAPRDRRWRLILNVAVESEA